MENSIKGTATNYGLYLGIGLALTTALCYAIDIELLTKWWLGILIFVVTIVIGIMSAVKAKKLNNGLLSFKNAFSSYFITVAIGIIISTIVSIVIFNVVDPEAAITLKEKTIEATVNMMRSFNAPESEIAKAVSQMEEQKNQYAIGSILQQTAIYLLIQAIIGLIVGAIVKKNEA